MKSEKSLLIIGHSHAICMLNAIRRDKVENAFGVNMRKIEGISAKPHRVQAEIVLGAAEAKEPEIVCLCLGGNESANLGMFEHAVPYAVGEQATGSAPVDPSRHFVPYEVMKAHFDKRVARLLFREIFKVFPNSAKAIINTPPPVGDWDHISNHLGSFKDRLTQGPGPLELRLQLYRIQSTVLRNLADEMGVQFIDVAENAADDQGFLKPEYFNPDPTHGNLDYGRLMLAKVMKDTGAVA